MSPVHVCAGLHTADSPCSPLGGGVNRASAIKCPVIPSPSGGTNGSQKTEGISEATLELHIGGAEGRATTSNAKLLSPSSRAEKRQAAVQVVLVVLHLKPKEAGTRRPG